MSWTSKMLLETAAVAFVFGIITGLLLSHWLVG